MPLWIRNLALSKYSRLVLLVLVNITIAIQLYATDGIANFIIFKTASQRLLAYQNLYDYIQYGIIYDKFFYAPPFAFLFIPLANMPLMAGVFTLLLGGSLLLWYAIEKMPLLPPQKAALFFIILIEMITSLQNLQTNVLNTAFILLTFTCLHQGRPVIASLFPALSLCIKIYPALAGLLFLFYPGKVKFVLSGIIFSILLFSLPLIAIPSGYYITCLQNWLHALSDDAADKFIYNSPSLVGINYTWLSKPFNHFYIQLAGLLVTLLPLHKIIKKQADSAFIMLYLAFLMLFMVLFNHAAESPTYIIAVTGAALWYILSNRKTGHHVMLVLLFAACILLPSDLYPAAWKEHFFVPLKIRAIPIALIWLLCLYQLMRYKTSTPSVHT